MRQLEWILNRVKAQLFALLPLDVNRFDIRECIFDSGTDGECPLTGVLHTSERNMGLAGGSMLTWSWPGLDPHPQDWRETVRLPKSLCHPCRQH